jgi:hypothetical protein
MLKIVSTLLILMIFNFAIVADASEVFLMLSFKDSSRVYRVVSDEVFMKPLGYFFPAEKNFGMYVDAFKDFRMLKMVENPVKNWQKLDKNMVRQVFDGKISQADRGLKTRTCSDERIQIFNEASGRPVFRSAGAPFSFGPGKKINLKPDIKNFFPGEIEIIHKKNLYQIPNDSWYQTWHKIPESNSYAVFYDCWEKAGTGLIESFWRGETPGKVSERRLTDLEEQRLIRAKVDGALQLLPGHEMPFVAFSCEENVSWAFDAGTNYSRGRLVIYSWILNQAGRVLCKNVKEIPPVLFESLDTNKRFIGICQHSLMVMGSDIFRNWLDLCGQKNSGKNADLAAFFNEDDGEIVDIAVFDKNSSELFMFGFNVNNAEPELLQRIKILFKPEHMVFDHVGNLFMTVLEKQVPVKDVFFAPGMDIETMFFDHNEDKTSYNQDEGYKSKQVPDKITGQFIFSEAYNQNLYVLRRGEKAPELIRSVYLNKNFFMKTFEILNPPADYREISYQEIANLADKKPNRISHLIDKVPNYPNQFVKPDSVCIAIFR